MARTRRPLPAALARAARRLEEWRGRRTRRVISPELWRQATRLARRHGVSPTASALRLDYYELKRRAAAPASVSSSSDSGPAFIEIGPAPSSSSGECTVEIENVRGTKLRVHLKGFLARDLTELAEHLLGRRRG